MRYLLIAGFFAVLSGNAIAWGGKGHRMIGSLAEKRLAAGHPATLKKVKALLNPGVSLASIASCADSIRDYVSGHSRPGVTLPDNCLVSQQEALAMFPATGTWHFVNIPVPKGPGRNSSILRRACNAKPPCVLSQIDRFTAQLGDTRLDNKTRAIAMMFLVHLVGDIHQPLHAVSRNNDRGGNGVFVRVRAHTSRLHSLWDTFLVDPLEEADVLSARARTRPGGPEAWAWESYEAARTFVYRGVPDQPTTQATPIVLPDPAYRGAAVPLVKRRLRDASVRLADLLVRTLGD